MTTTVVLVPGTWANPNDWTSPASTFTAFLKSQGFDPLPFVWSGDVDGVPDPFENGKFSDWRAAGWALNYFMQRLPYDARNVICHSHGGQVPAFAAVETQLQIRNVLTVCTPVRQDLEHLYISARAYMNRWRHVHANGYDFWQRAGELLDGHVGWQLNMPPGSADDNVGIPGIEHHLLLTEATNYELWTNDGLLDVLRTPARAAQGV